MKLRFIKNIWNGTDCTTTLAGYLPSSVCSIGSCDCADSSDLNKCCKNTGVDDDNQKCCKYEKNNDINQTEKIAFVRLDINNTIDFSSNHRLLNTENSYQRSFSNVYNSDNRFNFPRLMYPLCICYVDKVQLQTI
jgi:hypothetical protein